ncbi:hypothetical protein GOQ27_14385 [Clostridium sp. D2Q-11]|uniref:Uncharacterized protein n=1 Tax=Anaeromonas frigoriresistens TaxID=2683708 RepID=A0A942UZH0_9FIRM|nr:hypothetical protein [Anaeromonas frigoriresistens]MBS4539659.1 hypothetical protein [Anaeromonas frigoriresistens]
MNILSNLLSGIGGVLIGGFITWWSNLAIQKKKVIFELQQERYIETKKYIEELINILEKLNNRIYLYHMNMVIYYEKSYSEDNDNNILQERFKRNSDLNEEIDTLNRRFRRKLEIFNNYVDTNEILLLKYKHDLNEVISKGQHIFKNICNIKFIILNNVIELKKDIEKEVKIDEEYKKEKKKEYQFALELVNKNNTEINKVITFYNNLLKIQLNDIYGNYVNIKNKKIK